MIDKIYFIRQKYTPFGGAERYLKRLSKELEKLNIDYEIIHLKAFNFLPSWIKAILFNIQVCSKKKGFYFSLDRISCPDIYRAGDGVHKVFLKTKKRKLNPLNPIYLYLEKKAFKNAKYIIANSNMVKKEIINEYRIDPKKIEVIYNGVEIESFDEKKAKEKIAKQFNLDISKKIILFVGSGFERKGVKKFLEICSHIKTPFYAFIVGKDKNMKKYQTLAKKMNLLNHIFFTGAREDVKEFYAASDIFLFPTKYEPFSNVILEAMSFKNAAITTIYNGANEILRDEFIIRDFNDNKIVSTIEKLLNNENYLKDVKNYNFEIAKKFSMEKNAKLTIQLVKKAVKKR